MDTVDLGNPIINSPYDPPEQHFEIGTNGPTGRLITGRRPSESFIPIPATRKGKKGSSEQQTIDFDVTGERRERNSLINDIRFEVERWRARGYPGVTPITRKLLKHWSAGPPVREDPVLFCQREVAETAVFLAEVAIPARLTPGGVRLDPPPPGARAPAQRQLRGQQGRRAWSTRTTDLRPRSRRPEPR